jgi:hypothetical protein
MLIDIVRGKAWPGQARHGGAWRGEARLGVAWRGKARKYSHSRRGWAWQGWARQGAAWHGMARRGNTHTHGVARLGRARRGWAWQGEARKHSPKKWRKKTKMKEEKTVGKLREVKRQITLVGVTPLMFDRYSGNNKEQLGVMEKVYTDTKNRLVIPSTNLLSFLSAQNTESAPQRVIGRGYKEVCKAALSFVTIDPLNIPLTRDGKELTMDNANLQVHVSVAKIMKGKLAVPNPKERPVLDTPWELTFNLTLLETPELNENLLKRLFEIGGIAIGIGTFRGVYGKFHVQGWDAIP